MTTNTSPSRCTSTPGRGVCKSSISRAVSTCEPVECTNNSSSRLAITTNSLCDFIIALDKDKADHLRYKVVDDSVVKIFITPYRTTITEKDLEFSQGDYNVELVLALNVENSEHIDAALTAHGKILHDATVATITAGEMRSGLGSIDWHENNVSGVSEMVVEIIEELKSAGVALDGQIATALLTGIVAVTDRFSNQATSSKVMTVVASLMAAGANQQLVMTKIGEAEEAKEASHRTEEKETAGGDAESSDSSQKEPDKHDGTLSISHEKRGNIDEVAQQTTKERQEASARLAEEKLAHITSANSKKEVQDDIAPRVAEPASAPTKLPQVQLDSLESPSIGGTLNATTKQAAEDKIKELKSEQNKTILRHDKYIGADAPAFGDTPLNATMGKSDEPPKIDPFAGDTSTAVLPGTATSNSAASTAADESIMTAIANDTDQLTNATASAVSAMPRDDRQSALAAVDAALTAAPVTLPVATPGVQQTAAPTLADIEAHTQPAPPAPTLPPMPPMPDFSTLPPMPPSPTGVATTGSLPTTPTAPSSPPADFNPSQFQIPSSQ